MTRYVEYDLEDGTTVLIEAPEPEKEESGGLVPTGPKRGEKIIVKAQKCFEAALKEVRVQAKLLLQDIEELHVQEAEIKFGLNTVGELGNLAIGKLGLGVNYEITLKWKELSADEK